MYYVYFTWDESICVKDYIKTGVLQETEVGELIFSNLKITQRFKFFEKQLFQILIERMPILAKLL